MSILEKTYDEIFNEFQSLKKENEALRISLSKDRSDRKLAEEALSSINQRLELLLTSTPAVMYSSKTTGNYDITFISKNVKKLLGYNPEEFINDSGFRLKNIHPEDSRRVLNEMSNLFVHEILVHDYRFKHKDGGYRWLHDESQLKRGEKGNPSEISGFWIDISESKRVVEELRDSQAKLTNAHKIAHLGSWEYNVLNDIFTFNDSFYAIFRTTAMQVGGYTMSSAEYSKRFIHPGDKNIVSIETKKAIETDDPNFSRKFELRIIYADGQTGYITVQFFIIKDENGRTIRTYGVNQDITQQKLVEAEIERQNLSLKLLSDYSLKLASLASSENLPDIILNTLKKLTNADFCAFSEYDHKKHALITTKFESKKSIINQVIKIAGRKILNIESPVSEDMYKEIVTNIVGLKFSLNEVSFGAIPKTLDKIIMTLTGFNRFFGIAFVVDEELFGTAVIALKPEQVDPYIELLSSFANISAVALRRKKTEKELIENELIFKSFLENSPVYVFFKDKDIKTLKLSRNYEQMLGIPVENALGKTMDDLFPSDLAKRMMEDDKEILSGGRLITVEEELNGRYYETTKFPIQFDNQSKMLAGFTLDITDRKRAEEALRLSSMRYETLLTKASDGILTMTITGKIIGVNESFAKMHGYSIEDILKMDIRDLDTPEIAQLIPERMSRIIAGETLQFETEHYHKDGHILTIEVTVSSIIIGEEIFIQAFHRSITERKRVEEELRESEANLEEAQRIAHIGSWELDISNHKFTWSEETYRMFGVEKGAYSPTMEAFFESVHPDDRSNMNEVTQASWYENKPFDVDHRIILPNGTVRIVHELAEVIFNDAGQPIKMVGTVQDITERRLSEIQIQYQANLLANVSDAILATDRQFNIQYWNLEAEKQYGWSAVEVLGNHFMKFIQPQYIDEPRKTVIYKITHDGYWKGELLHNRRDGTIFPVQVTISEVRNPEGQVIGHITINRDITKNKLAEDALRQSEENYKLVVSNISSIIWKSELSQQGTFENTYISEIADELLQVPAGTIGNSWDKYFSYIKPQYLEEIYNIFMDGARNPDMTVDYIYEVTKGNGEIAWFYSKGKSQLKDGKISFFGYTTDITERKLAEDAHRTSVQKLALHFQQTPLAVIEYDMDGYIKEWNPAAVKMFGYLPEEAIGQFRNFIVPGKIHGLLDEVWESIVNIDGGYRSSNENITKEGKIIYCEWFNTPLMESDGSSIGVASLVMDVTERKHAEELLRESEERYSTIVNCSPNIIFIHKNGIIHYVNSIGEKLLGYTIEETIGKSMIEFVAEESKSIAISNMQRRAAGENLPAYELNVLTKSGETKIMLIQATFIPFDKEKVFLVVLTDITELKEYQKELVLAKAKAEENDRLKTAFLQNMSHEIRTPLNGIIGFSKLLAEREISKEEVKEFTGIIQQSGNRLLELVNNVLDISKIETGQLEIHNKTFSINQLIADLYTFFSSETELKQLTFNYHNSLEDKFSFIYSDESKINQILTNLIHNAIKYTQAGSIEFGYEVKVYKSSDDFQSSDDYLKVYKSSDDFQSSDDYHELNQNVIQFYVKDTGIGIAEDMHERIFERFMQGDVSISRGYEGAGLGLAICKGLVELLGGKIWLESEINKGTTFYFNLPYNYSNQIEDTSNREVACNVFTEISKPYKIKILIAEDDMTSYIYLSKVLEHSDWELIRAENGVQAIELVRNTPDIDLILMDIRMPVMDGIKATKLIKEFKPDLPIIAQTAYAFSQERENILAIGCDDYISKPIDVEKLMRIIDKYIK
ncbi:MAG: hypothetical protein HW421_3824 [Ignavibacteria bacterium]|nr:hypothetical protein [Ignavibacteria bacterium]